MKYIGDYERLPDVDAPETQTEGALADPNDEYKPITFADLIKQVRAASGDEIRDAFRRAFRELKGK